MNDEAIGRRPLAVRWARFGPADARWFMHVPVGGFCLSAFVIVRNRHGDALLGRPRDHAVWPEKGCLPHFRVREIIRRKEWILPASHLLVEEAPDRAAQRICRDWAGLSHARLRLIALDSSRLSTEAWVGRGDARRRIYHWAVGFVYEARSDGPAPSGPWWSETKFVPLAELRRVRIGRAHRDIIHYLNFRSSKGAPLPVRSLRKKVGETVGVENSRSD